MEGGGSDGGVGGGGSAEEWGGGGGESRLNAPGQQFPGMLLFKRVNKTDNIRSEKLCSTVMRAATGI